MAVKTYTKDNIDQFIALTERQIMQAFVDVAPDIVASIQDITPVRTGKLQESVTFEVEERAVGFGSADVLYAKYVQWGTIYQKPQRNFDRGLENAIPAIKSALSKVK